MEKIMSKLLRASMTARSISGTSYKDDDLDAVNGGSLSLPLRA
jgi:hypothetical protein